MESKSIKIVDEHGIDRTANVIFSIDVDGSDYVVYWIERDNESDNIFVSKIIKNIDGTASMINIEDSMEKAKIAEIVKELITYSVKSEDNNITSQNVFLPSGKSVVILTILINKEQNINVQKTYITTVKKAVTKVTEDYYKIDNSKEVIFEDVPVFPIEDTKNVNDNAPSVSPVVNDTIPEVREEVKSAEVEPVSVLPVPEVKMEMPKATIPTEIKTDIVTPSIVPPVIEPVLNEGVSVDKSVSIISPVKEEVKPIPQPVTADVKIPDPILTPNQPVNPIPVVNEPIVSQAPTVNKLVFDGSKESNLNKALGEAVNDNVMVTSNVEPIREFGVDTVNTEISKEAVVSENPSVESNSKPKILTRSGFADNKFFMVVAIAFFLASCIFLGYEVFNYFQVK